jgi:hypothetical protein
MTASKNASNARKTIKLARIAMTRSIADIAPFEMHSKALFSSLNEEKD